MTQVLLVYEMVSETTTLYCLQLEDDDLSRVVKCHGRFLDYDSNDDGLLLWLSGFLEKQAHSICYGSTEERPPFRLDGPCMVVVSG